MAWLSDYSKGHLSKVENGLRQPTPRLIRLYESLADRSTPAPLPRMTRLPVLPTTTSPLAPCFGGEVRRARTNRGLSLRRLSAASGVSYVYISKIETGLAQGSPYAAARLDKALGQQGRLVDLFHCEARPAAGSAAIPTPSMLAGLAACHHYGASELQTAIETLEHLRMRRHVYGPRSVIGDVAENLLMLHAAAAAAKPHLAAAIRGVEARFAEYVSWLAEELSDLDASRTWMAVAVSLGREAGDERIVQYAAIRRSATALRAGDTTRAAQHAKHALACAGLSLRLRRAALQCEARAHAKRGEQQEFRQVINTFHELADDDDPADGEWQWGPPSETSVAASGLAEATGLMELGDYRAAAELFAVAMPTAFPTHDGLTPRARNTMVRFAIREATTYAHVHECDRAAAVIGSILPAVAPASSTIVRQELRRLASIIARRPAACLQALAPDVVTLARANRPNMTVANGVC